MFEKSARTSCTGWRTAPGWDWADYAKVLVHQVTMPYLERFVEITGVPRSAAGDHRH